MNNLAGKISDIKVNGSLSLITINVNKVTFKSIVIETPATASYLKVGNPIRVLFKETEVIIGTGEISNVSLQNRIDGKVSQIEKGALISKVVISTEVGEITSVITSGAVDQLDLSPGKEVIAMIKTNEILLSE